jgi:hypothetical protein
MGYYVNTQETVFSIAADKVAGAFEALKKLNHDDDKKTSGLVGFNMPDSGPSFRWMDEDYDTKARDLKDIFDMLSFDGDYEEDGSYTLYGYSDKTGDEEIFLRELAPYVTAGSYIIWQGEEGELWKMIFDGESMAILEGKVIFM